MKNNNRGGDGGLYREGGLLTFFPLKREGAYYREGAYLRGGFKGFTVFSQKKCGVNKVANFKDFLRNNREIKYFSRTLTEFKEFSRRPHNLFKNSRPFSRLYEQLLKYL